MRTVAKNQEIHQLGDTITIFPYSQDCIISHVGEYSFFELRFGMKFGTILLSGKNGVWFQSEPARGYV